MIEFRHNRRVQFAEVDMAGVVHFANYFRYMEETEHAMWRQWGLSVHTLSDGRTVGWPKVAATCEYAAPLKFEDEVDLNLRVTHLGEKSMTYEVEFYLAGRRACLGRVASVCCVIENGRLTSISVPPELRARLEGLHA